MWWTGETRPCTLDDDADLRGMVVMRRLLWVLLVVVAFIVVACGDGGDDDGDSSNGAGTADTSENALAGDDEEGSDGTDTPENGGDPDDGNGETVSSDVGACGVLSVEAVSDATGVDNVESEGMQAGPALTCTYSSSDGTALISLVLLPEERPADTWSSDMASSGMEEVDTDGAAAYWWNDGQIVYVNKGGDVAALGSLMVGGEDVVRALTQTVADGMPD